MPTSTSTSTGSGPGPWTQIEAAAPQPTTGRSPAGAVGTPVGVGPHGGGRGAASAAVRLRRHARPVLGALDAGGVALQRGAGVAILGSAVFIVPIMGLNLLAARAAFDRFEDIDGSVMSVSQLFTGVDAATGVDTVFTWLTLVANSVAVAFAGGYLASLVSRRALGQPDDPRRSLSVVARRLHVLFLAWLVSHSWMLLAHLIAAQATVEDVASVATLAFPLVLFLVSITVFVIPVAVVEGLGPVAAVRRALRLARSRMSTVLGFGLGCVLIGGGLRAVIAALPRLIEGTGIISFGSLGSLAEGVAAQLAQLIVVPLIALATATLYLQVRMDAEGLDLVLEAERAFA